MLFLTMVITQSGLRKKHTFYKCAHIWGPSESTHDFDCIPGEIPRLTKMGYLPGPLDPQNKSKNSKQMHQEMGSPPARPSVRASGGS